jgi:hypothetical protein
MHGGRKTMKWLKRLIVKWVRDDWEEARLSRAEIVSASPRDHLRNEGLNFTLHRAVGGYIFESKKYNEKTDRHENTLYMIHEDEDFAKQVAQAIMLEQMKL